MSNLSYNSETSQLAAQISISSVDPNTPSPPPLPRQVAYCLLPLAEQISISSVEPPPSPPPPRMPRQAAYCPADGTPAHGADGEVLEPETPGIEVIAVNVFTGKQVPIPPHLAPDCSGFSTKKRKHGDLQELRDDLRKSEPKKPRYSDVMLRNEMLACKKEIESLNRIISDLQAKNQALHQALKSERKPLYVSSASAKGADTKHNESLNRIRASNKTALLNAIARLNLSPGSSWKDVTDASNARYDASIAESKPKPLEDSAFSYAASLFSVANNESTFEQLEEEQGKN